jgi:hypothetical protein
MQPRNVRRRHSFPLGLSFLLVAIVPACAGDIKGQDPPPSPGSTSGSGGATNGSGGSTNGSGGSTTGSGGSTSGSGGSIEGTGGSASGTGGNGGATSGSGGSSSGSGGSTSGSGGASCTPGGLPADIQALFATCSACHGSTPLPGSPPLVTYANLTAPSNVSSSETNAQRALVRLQSTSNPMPPAGSPRPSATMVTALQTWISNGYPMAACQTGSGGSGGSGGNGGSGAGSGGSSGSTGTGGSDPFAGPSVCTSKTMWSGGDRGSASMNPGKACINCHRSGEGPSFALAGTLYPTAHEPDLCNGTNGSTTGAQIVITDANGKKLTLTPNAVGNFSYQGTVATPFQASVTYMGRERRMLTAQTNGDCNSCHTTSGAMSAPGRILLP